MNSIALPRDRSIFFFIGFASLLIQVTLVRQLLSVLSGNEIEIGVTLSAWLLFHGMGSLAGGRLRIGRQKLALAFLGSGLLLFPTVAWVRGVRLFLGIPPGELLSLPATLLVTVLTVAPLALVSGIQYPLAVGILGDRKFAGPRVYVLETLGFFIAGLLFTFVISTRIDAVLLATGLSSLLILMAALTWGRPALLAAVVLPVMAFFLWGGGIRALPYKPFSLEDLRESRYGELALVRSGSQFSLFRSGQFLYPLDDAESDEIPIHLAMSIHAQPGKVLVLGEAPGRAAEFLKYPGTRVTYVVEDPVIQDLLLAHDETVLPSAPGSPAVSVVRTEGRRFLKEATGSWDLVFLDMAPPSTAAGNRFFTREFFEEVRRVLKPDGIFVLLTMRGHGYLSPSATRVNASVRNALETVFPEVVSTSLEYGLLIASLHPVAADPEIMVRRFTGRNVPTRFFQSYVFQDAFMAYDIAGATPAEETLPENTDARPVAYLFNLLHWAELQESRLASAVLRAVPRHLAVVIGGVLVAIAALCSSSRKRAVYLSTFSTGFVSLSLSMTLVLGFQAHFGHAYEAIALLTSAFMVGACLGAQGSLHFPEKRVLGSLAGVEAVFLLLCLALPGLPPSVSAFYAANLCAGLLTGGQFALATRSITGSHPGPVAARLYGLDMVGSSTGALLAATVIVPVAGLGQTFLFLALAKGASLLALLPWLRSSR